MAKEGDYTISNIYQGGYSSFKPYNTEATAGSMGLTTDPRNANILQEVSSKLSTGVKHIEIEVVSPDMIDQIPKQQMEEVRRLKELTGIEVSMHGPVVDTTGITQQGFSELNREDSERKIVETIRRSHDLDPKGNIIVNFHSAEGIPGTEWKKIPEGDKEGEARKLIVVNRESGRLAPLEEERMYYPHYGTEKEKIKGKIKTPERGIKILNATEWDNSISQLIFNKERADEILETNAPLISQLFDEKGKPKFDAKTIEKSPTTMKAVNHFNNVRVYLEDTRQHIEGLFHKAYKYGDEKQKKELIEISEQFKKDLEKNQSLQNQSTALQNLLLSLKDPAITPVMNVPVEQFAVEQSSKTFGNAAFESWKKFKDSAPIVSIENPPAGFALSTGEDLKNLAKASRKQFVKNAVESGELSEQAAKKQAEKLIGVTLDVGHMNMLRKQGLEEKDIVKEAEKVAPYLKHIHLSDNFGFEHTELPMGMGNVPTKEIMKKLGKKGFEAKKIIEAAHWWQHMKSPPVKESFEAMGSQIYSDGTGPYWNQSIGFQQDYYGGYGLMLPSVHYNMQGAGFSQLPSELGGQMPGAQGSRMSGRGME